MTRAIITVAGLVLLTAGGTVPGQLAPEFVSMDLIRKAARFYGEERWPECRIVSITPYLATDGATNAYAVQFSKKPSSLDTEQDVAAAAALARDHEKTVRAEKPAPLEPPKTPSDPAAHASVIPAIVQNAGGASGKVRVHLPSAVLAAGDADREQIHRYEERLQEWRKRVRDAANASVLRDEVGTVILAARTDLYPLLERFDGVAPHVKDLPKIRRLTGLPDDSPAPIRRTFYLGPGAFFHEPTGRLQPSSVAPSVLIDPKAERTFDMSRKTAGSGNGRLPSAPSGKNPIPPAQFWKNLDADGIPLRSSDRPRPLGSDTIPGVPYYHQDDYGAACCGPCASAQALGYWDDNGYGNLVDNGSATTGHEEELIYDLMRAENYGPSVGTYGSAIEPGIEAVCNAAAYGNNLDFNVVSDYAVDWTTDITTQIANNHPFVYFNWNTVLYPYWAHFTTGTGYNDDAIHLLYVHYNYPPDTPHELNWDAISPDNEAIYKVSPGTTPSFDCVWSEDFEGAFPNASWSVGDNGGSPGHWDETSYRSHNITTNPSPPGGDSSWSAYCVDSAVSAPGPYPNNINGWMIQGPLSTLGRADGEISAYLWRVITDGGTSDDWVGLLASTNGVDFSGNSWWGNSPSWNQCTLALTNVYDLGNLMNHSQVWVAVWFQSDALLSSEGAYVDNVTIKLSGTASPPSSYQNLDNRVAFPAPFYSWIEIAPPEGGAGTAVSWDSGNGDDGYDQVLVGFSFPFFGHSHTNAFLASNGFLSFGAGSTAWSNAPLPSASTPNGVVAVFWDDLDTTDNPDSDVYYAVQGAPGDRRFIAEWYKVTHFSDATAAYTFEVILYEASGNIRCQYRTMSNGTALFADGRSATLGIENTNGTDGAEYWYGLSGPGPVSNGLALLYYEDSDDDGIQDWWETRYFGSPAAVSPSDDNDHDGMNNLEESIAGTDPTNALSVLKMTDADKPGVASTLVLRWQSASNKVYRIDRTTNQLTSAQFVPVFTNFAATPPENAYTTAIPAAGRAFYRVEIEGF